jgi:hypothetical protein
MKCRKVQEWISLEIDDQLPPEHVRHLQDHLQACDECRAFREDLHIGLRMLHATDPVLPDNFDWKLQLRLSQTLRETARDTAYPWHGEESGWRRWFARASLSAALGLAAVLAVAVMAPGQMASLESRGGAMALADEPLRLPVQTNGSETTLVGPTRRAIEPARTLDPFGRRGGVQRTVSSGDRFGGGTWSPTADHDLLRIQQLEQELATLKRRMLAKDQRIAVLQARLDSLTGRAVDTD